MIKALTIGRSCSRTGGRQNCRFAANADTPLSCSHSNFHRQNVVFVSRATHAQYSGDRRRIVLLLSSGNSGANEGGQGNRNCFLARRSSALCRARGANGLVDRSIRSAMACAEMNRWLSNMDAGQLAHPQEVVDRVAESDARDLRASCTVAGDCCGRRIGAEGGGVLVQIEPSGRGLILGPSFLPRHLALYRRVGGSAETAVHGR